MKFPQENTNFNCVNFTQTCGKPALRKSYEGKMNTNFHGVKVPKDGPRYICLLVIFINFPFRTGKNYYPQVLLEEFKYIVKEKKML